MNTMNVALIGACLLAAVLASLREVPPDLPRPDEKIKALIVTGHDAGAHKWRDTTPHARKVLEDSGRFEVRVSEDVGILESSTLGRYDVLILNFGFWEAPELNDRARQGLLEFVRSGKGLVALHFACSSYQGWDEYRELLGRVWKKDVGGHGPRGTFRVRFGKSEHPVIAGMKDFDTDDELYARLTGDAGIEVLASAHSEWSGADEPIVWVKPYGQGRVVHNVLGHDLKARQAPEFERLLLRGTEWAARGSIAGK